VNQNQSKDALIAEILTLSQPLDARLKAKIDLLIEHCRTNCSEREELLQKRIDEEIKKREEREKILQSQAKMAAMGEMMDAVAHQWKQPLNALSMYSDLLRMDFRAGEVTETYIDQFVDDLQHQIMHMVTTLSEFRTFFRPDKSMQPFGVKRCVQSVLMLVRDEMIHNNIEITVDSHQEIIINGIENEFKHLLLNLLSNAKDAFAQNRLFESRQIRIRFYHTDANTFVEVEDTAGGIDTSIVNDIFKPNFTTKGEGKGTGIGLYMSTQIAQKLQGTLAVSNTSKGALFRLSVPTCTP